MGVLQRIRDAIFGKRIVDPFFRQLDFDRTEFLVAPGEPRSRKHFQYWLGHIVFEPTASEIGVLLPGDETGPTEEQREVFRELASRWSEMTGLIANAIYPVYCEWFANSLVLERLNPKVAFNSLKLIGVGIEHPKLYPSLKQFQDLELHFEAPGENGHDLVAHVKDWQVVRAGFE
jgi:hypothetical protein